MDLLKRLMACLMALALLLGGAIAEENTADDYEDDVLVTDPEEEVEFIDQLAEELAKSAELVGELRHLLLVGIDARPGEKTGRSDTIIVVTVDPEKNEIKLTSIMRDLYVEIPGYKNNRINATYSMGGPELLMATIEENFGLHVEKYIAVNFSMLGSLIDSIGGLTLNVESEYIMERINAVIEQDNIVLGIDPDDQKLTQPGEQLMTGKQAQAYARYRYGDPTGDFGRTARQREVITKIFEKICQLDLDDLSALMFANIGNVYTNLSFVDLTAYMPAMLAMKDAEFEELRLPIDGGYSNQKISGMAVLVPDREKNAKALMEFLGE